MTVETTQNKMPPLQMGTAIEYPFTFAVLLQDPTEEEALKAIKANVLQADGTEIELVYGVDYTVNLNSDRIGGTVFVKDVRTSGDYLTIYREYTHTQEVDYQDLNAAPAETFEQCFDKLTMLSQQQQEAINRSLKLNISSTTVSPTLPEPIANNTLIWDSEGASLKNYDIIGENKAFQENVQEQFDNFEVEVNTKIEQVSEAAGKINALEQAVLDAENSANIAQEQVQVITNQAEQLIQDVSKEVARVEDTVEEIDKNINKIINHVSFNLFDTKITDCILSGKEAKGWALQGTYVTKKSYPDFYNKCLAEYNNSQIDYVSTHWEQPKATANSTAIDAGDMIISASSSYDSSRNPYKAFDGNTSSSYWAVAKGNTTGWLKIQFPYKIVVKGLNVYNGSLAEELTKDAQFFTSETMKTPIGNAFVGSSSVYGLTQIQGIPQEGIVTDTIYLNITSSYGTSYVSIGEIEIIGEKYHFTSKRNINGHKFYNIVEKASIDAFYDTCGIADFYGIDKENERIFLPRNKYFAITGEVPVAGNGMTLGLTNGKYEKGMVYGNYSSAYYGFVPNGSVLGDPVGVSGNTETAGTATSWGIITDPTKSGIEAKLTPNENKYLYYCVGNTEVTQAITNVTEVTTSENDTIPLFTGMYFDFKPNNVSWLKAGEQQNNAGIYKTCYDTLVEIVNGVNNYDLKVINQADMVSGVIYDEYWILDQDNYTFKTPIRTSERVLIECKVATDNDSTWYNLYSDGWLEQGGQLKSGTDSTPVSFLKSYKNLSYTLSYAQGSNDTNHDGSIDVIQTSTRTIGGFIVNKYLADVTSFWQACGYADVPTSNNLYFKVANAVQNLELLNAGEVLEAVADKISHQDCPAYIVETYKNGTSWYRIYSDGWCEQGGELKSVPQDTKTTVNLLKSFANANYSVIITATGGERSSGQYMNGQSVQSRTTSSFVMRTQDYAFGRIWQASGNIA